jgi:sugar phosphate isomerase/epimerase
VDAYRQLTTSCARIGVRISIEPKPTDPATRFSITPNTATALLLTQEVGHTSFGLTIDIGHALLAGENPAHSIALAARAGRLFGLHLNDAHVRLGAEDGLPFGSVNQHMALEVVRQLQKAKYDRHIYFDTFPAAVDPVAEAGWNVRKFKSLWRQAAQLSGRLDGLSQQQDALGVLQLLLDESEGQQQATIAL